ncbi:hypothetical protein L6R53_07430 [Myxococcota bacterium]|nr:hypothetical protein [Myxococcota bacterium]
MTAQRLDRRWRAGRAAVLVAFAGALGAPAWVAPTTHVLGSWRTDTVKHVWSLWLGRQVLAERPAIWGRTELVNHPDGMDIMLVEPLGGLVALLLSPLPLPLVANLLAFANLVLLGLFTAALADRVTQGDRLAGLVAGLVAMGSATTAFFFHLGVGEIQHLFVIPMVLWALERVRARPRPAEAMLLAGSLWLAMLAGHYLALLCGLAALAAGLGALLVGPQRGRLLLALGAAAVVAVLPVGLLVESLRDAGPVENLTAEKNDWRLLLRVPPTEAQAVRLDLARLAWPFRGLSPGLFPAYVGGQYLGPIPLLLAAWGVAGAPRRALPLAAAAATGLLFAMGSQPVVAAAEVELPGGTVLPFAWLSAALHSVAVPPHYPVRFVAVAMVGVAVLGALAIAGRTNRRVRLALVGLALVGIADANLRGEERWPWPVTELTPVRFLDGLRQVDDGAVLDLSWYSQADQDGRNQSAWYQVQHGLPTQIVPITRLDRLHREGAARALALPMVEELRQIGTGTDDAPGGGGDHRADLALLREDGFRWILVFGERHRPAGDQLAGGGTLPAGEVAVLSMLLGPPTFEEGSVAAWRLPELTLPEEELAPARARRLQGIPQATERLFRAPP